MPATSPQCCCGLPTPTSASLINRAKAVAAAVQRRDIALLLDGRPEIVGRAGADGAHITGIEAFAAALPTLKPDRIAGAGGLRSRHDAMLAGENGRRLRHVRRARLAAAMAAALRHDRGAAKMVGGTGRDSLHRLCGELPTKSRPLAQAGADFVALGDWIWTHPEGAAAAVAAAAGALAEPA